MAHVIETKGYGKVAFIKVFYSMPVKEQGKVISRGGSIGILQNGSWCHFPTGQPIQSLEDGKRILKEANPAYVSEFERWWQRKLEQEARADEDQPRAITLTGDGRLVYVDNPSEEVLSAEDIHAYFQPGPHRDMIFTIFMRAEMARSGEEQRAALAHHNATEDSLDILNQVARGQQKG